MIDIIGIIILLLFFFKGWQKGIVVAAASLLGIVLGMLVALKLSSVLGAWMLEHGWVTSAWAQIISFLLLFFVVMLLVRMLAKAIEGVLEIAMLGIINRIIGGILYAFIGAFIWSAILWIGNRAHMFAPETLASSNTYQWFEPVAPWVFAHIGAVIPFAKDVFNDLSHFFDGVNRQLPEHVDSHR
jgi:membrane protein required for colicin V production